MNKKIIAAIIGVLVILGIASAAYMFNGNSSNSNSNLDSNNEYIEIDSTNVNENEESDDEENLEEETENLEDEINTSVTNTNTTNSTNNNTNSNTNIVANNNATANTNSNVAANTTNNNTQTQTQNTTAQTRALVLYFSASGNTQAVANFIHENVGGDIVRLETVNNYPSDYNELLDYVQNEQRNNARPELKTSVNLDNYDVIFIGYPNWWGDMPMPIYSFLDNYDLSGKTIAPFITHGGSGLSGTPAKIRSAEPNATVTEGLAVNGSSAKNSKSTVDNWIDRIGF